MNYFVYILQSQSDSSFYTGLTIDIERRIKEHNSGHSIYSSKHRPWKLVYSEILPTLQDARKREKYLKSAAGRKFRDKILSSVDTCPTD